MSLYVSYQGLPLHVSTRVRGLPPWGSALQGSALSKEVWVPVADPGFSPGGGANSQKWVRDTYFFGRKLHENERILAPRGGARDAPPP